MKIRTNVQAGGLTSVNHNATQARGLKIRSTVKAGGLTSINHSVTLVR